MSIAILFPLFFYYGLFVLSLCTGILACVGTFISHSRHRWILVASLSTILIESLRNYYFGFPIWEVAKVAKLPIQEIIWFTFEGLAPISLGVFSLVRWFRLKV